MGSDSVTTRDLSKETDNIKMEVKDSRDIITRSITDIRQDYIDHRDNLTKVMKESFEQINNTIRVIGEENNKTIVTFTRKLAEIHRKYESFSNQMHAVQASLDSIQGASTSISTSIKSVEGDLGSFHETLGHTAQTMQNLDGTLQSLKGDINWIKGIGISIAAGVLLSAFGIIFKAGII